MPAGLTARCPCFIRWKLDFHATFYLDRDVPADDEATSLGAIGGSAQNGAVAFATTHWSVVLTGQDESAAAQEALEHLCCIYWWPSRVSLGGRATLPRKHTTSPRAFSHYFSREKTSTQCGWMTLQISAQ